jgi:hypothetical protein
MKKIFLMLALFIVGTASAQKITPSHKAKTALQTDTAKVKPLLKKPDDLKEAPGKNDPNQKGSGVTISPADSPKLDTPLNPVTPQPVPSSPTTQAPLSPQGKVAAPAK